MPKSDLTFVDTNILAYAHDASEEEKQPLAESLLEELWESQRGALSTQVLQEFYVVATRKFEPPLTRSEARGLVSNYGEWILVLIDLTMIVNASELEEKHQLTFWDALIIEAARRCGAAHLVTEDIPSGTRIEGIAIENPFTTRAIK